MKENNKYIYKHIVRIVIEANTPIAVGTGEKDFITDSLVIKDLNGMPYIPGTSIAGVMRHAIGEERAKSFFGFNDNKNPENSIGSQIIFSNAIMLGENGEVLDGIKDIDFTNDFYSRFKSMPIRQHNRINHRGTVTDKGKFDEQIVYKGVRFCFEIEKSAIDADDMDLEDLVNALFTTNFRIGSGTRSGFGELGVVSCKIASLNLKDGNHLRAYLDKSSSLEFQLFWDQEFVRDFVSTNKINHSLKEYELKLKANDFFLFGAGFGNDDADMISVRESMVVWNQKNEASFKDDYVLFPASSVKGALSHRVAYHYNKIKGVFADSMPPEDYSKYLGGNNKAVKLLFGFEGLNSGNKIIDNSKKRGNVFFSDVFIDGELFKEKVFNHVAIDQFTGGGIDGVLFQELVLFGGDALITIKVVLDKSEIYDNEIETALELALKDIASGMLSLGGGVNRGHGSFEGELYINGEQALN